MATKSKKSSQNQNRQPQPQKSQSIPNNSTGPWNFGYPQCMNKKQSRLVCLHSDCQKYPFFCSSCEDESCQNQHQHNDKITSIGFKQLIKRLITERKAPEDLENSIKAYKTQLQELLKNVTEFVNSETKSVEQVLRKATQIQQADQEVIQRLKEKKYQQIKGKQLDSAWGKVVPTQQKKKLQKQTIQFINSKRVQVEEITQHFKDGLKCQSKPQNQQKTKSSK